MRKRVFTTALAVALATLVVQPAMATDGKRAEGMKRMDANGDGMLSRSEVAERPKLTQHFDRIDANKDGQLSREEMQAFRSAHGGKHGAKPAPQPAQ